MPGLPETAEGRTAMVTLARHTAGRIQGHHSVCTQLETRSSAQMHSQRFLGFFCFFYKTNLNFNFDIKMGLSGYSVEETPSPGGAGVSR